MPLKIAINGFGRVGRLVLRAGLNNPDLEFVAINDLKNPSLLTYLLKWDSTHGPFPEVIEEREDGIVIRDKFIPLLSIPDPNDIPWESYGADYVLDATGRFKDRKTASRHLKNGVKRVIIAAPAKDPDVPTLIFRVNHEIFKTEMQIVSMAGCTTNCLAPIVKILHKRVGLSEGVVTTIHAYTATQALVDGASNSPDWARNRDAANNIVPTFASVATTIGEVLPELQGRLKGTAIRVPVSDVSLIDFTFRSDKHTSYQEICESMKIASLGDFRGILGYADEPVVSSDFRSDPRSSIFDAGRGMEIRSRFFKVFAWYDNEWGFAMRLLDLMNWMARKESLLS